MSRYFFGLGLGLAGVLAAVVFFLSSPWLTWHSLPAGSTRIVLDDQIGQVPFVTTLIAAAQPDHIIQGAWADRIVYSVRHWSLPAARQALHGLLIDRVPLYPSAVMELPELLDEPLLVTITQQAGSLRLLAAASPEALTSQSALRPVLAGGQADMVTLGIPEATMALVIPGSSLQSLPEDTQAAWTTYLQQRLRFSRTKPNLMAALQSYEAVALVIRGEDIAIEITDPKGRFATEATTWVQDEERYGRPIEEAFRLPDGTIGRELVPGLAGTVWREADTQGCRAPIDGKTSLWLCQQGGKTLLTTALTLDGPQGIPPGQWLIALQEPLVAPLADYGITAMSLTGTDQRAAGFVTLRY